ncbi:MAG: IS481 family transposase [Actinomycetota bacterium]|nr:IS481 family transposase [Actinomycetota bacterium]
MGMPQLVVAAVLVEGRSKSEVAREYGVSRRWVVTLVQRYLAEGEAGLEPRSRRPHSSPSRTADAVEDEIIEIRKDLDRAGHEAGAATIAFHLAQRHRTTPAVSTIWRILSQRGFVIPQPHKRPKSSYCRFAAAQPNERWQLDITHWALADGTDVEICNLVDDHSRLCVGSDTLRVFKATDVVTSWRKAVTAYGFPASMLSDNGAVFTGIPRGHGRVALELALIAEGITFRHSRPYHPQTCGKVERFHQTLKKWLTRQPRARTLRQLQTQLDTFTDYYNTVRPHRALHRSTPAAAWHARPRAIPTRSPLTDSHYRIRRDRVDNSGVITLRHNSRLHHIGLGRRHAGTRVLVLAHDLHIRVLTEDGELLRELQLDPAKDYQPQPKL